MKFLAEFIILILLTRNISTAPVNNDGEIDSSFNSEVIRKSAQACNNFGKPPMRISSRIIGGSLAEIDEFPHFASIFQKTEHDGAIEFRCGGSLISENFVLTAAHCNVCKTSQCVVRLGTNTLNDTSEDYSGADFNVKNFIMPTGNMKYRNDDKANDIALVELEEKVVLKYNMWPACLVQVNPVENVKLLMPGFGRTSVENSLIKSDVLLKAELEEIFLEECRFNYTYHNVSRLEDKIYDTQLCAKNRNHHQDSCDGDSGGGLVFLSNGTYLVTGIASFGLSCNTSLPAFYTRVWMYLDWIEDIVWPNL